MKPDLQDCFAVFSRHRWPSDLYGWPIFVTYLCSHQLPFLPPQTTAVPTISVERARLIWPKQAGEVLSTRVQ